MHSITNSPLDLTEPKTIHIWKLYQELSIMKTIENAYRLLLLQKIPFWVCTCEYMYMCRSVEINKHSYVDIYNPDLNEITPSECEIHLWEGILDMHKCHFQGHTESVTI